MKQPHSRKRAFLAFLPALVVTGVVAGTAAGLSLITSATAANVTVTGTVSSTLDINAAADPSNDGTGGTCAASGGDASFSIAAGWNTAATRTGLCKINFGSSNGPVQLTMKSGAGGAGDPFYCLHQPAAARDCTGSNNVADVAAGGQPITSNTFGIALENTPTNATSGAAVTVDADNDAQTGDSSWYPIPDSASAATGLCQSVAPGTAECDFRLGLQGRGAAPTQPAGHYDGMLVLTIAQI